MSQMKPQYSAHERIPAGKFGHGTGAVVSCVEVEKVISRREIRFHEKKKGRRSRAAMAKASRRRNRS